MRKKNLNQIAVVLMFFISISAFAQGTENFKKKGYKLTFINQDPDLNPDTKAGLVSTFFKVYPKLVKDYNKKSIKHVTVKIDTAYGGVAFANDGQVTISSKWLKKMPLDFDMITHETMHLVQSYPGGSGPGWLTEGIADYVREKYGLANAEGGWSLPDYNKNMNYTDAYRNTARFLIWVEQNYDKKLVKKLDKHLREKTYKPELWKEYTGHTVDELWAEYSEDPSLS